MRAYSNDTKAINRTILELKLEKCVCLDVVINTINRTILELKREMVAGLSAINSYY